jgi:hemoglobin-like flavoprotein
MSPETIDLIETSFDAVKPNGPKLVEVFYARLFEQHPGVRPMFREDTGPQQAALLGALQFAVGNLRNPDALVPVLQQLGKRHVGYGVVAEHYPVVHDMMLVALAEVAGDLWTDDLRAAWSETLNLVATVMLQGAEMADEE